MRVRALVLLCVGLVLATAGAVVAGCASRSADVAERPFGTPPTPVAGLRAWASGEVGALLATRDGGASWARQKFFLRERGIDVAFSDAHTGWIITDAGAVLETDDGGARWKVVGAFKLQLKALAATDARHAWIAGSSADAGVAVGASAVLRTDDGGRTWARIGLGNAELADVAMADARHGVLVALDRIWSTRDGGRTWKLRRRMKMTVLTSAYAGDPGHAWVAGWGTRDGAPLVFATDDGGATWRKLRVDVPGATSGNLQAGQIAAAGSSRLWLTCNVGVIATQDGGATWRLQATPTGRPQAIAAADGEHLIATTAGQPILATADGGASWLAFGKRGFLKQPLVAVAAVAVPPED